MKKLLIAAPLVVAVAAVPALAGGLGGFGHRGHRPDPERMLEHADHVMDKVDASDEQKATVRGLFEEALPTMQGFRAEAGELREEMKVVFTAETIDRLALEEARLDMMDLADRASRFVLATVADAADVFTPEQRQELQALREQRRARFLERRGAGPEPR